MIFFRLFFGCISQIIPFAVLCFYPFDGYYRLTRKKTVLITALLLIGLSMFFAVSGVILAACLPNTWFLYKMVNLVFSFCLVPCLGWYLYAIKAIWQQKFFIFTFMLICAFVITSMLDCITTYLTIYLRVYYTDTLPYNGMWIPAQLLLIATVLPLLLLLIKYFYLPIRDELDKKEIGWLSFLSLFIFILFAILHSFINPEYLIADPASLLLFITLLITVFVIYIVIFRMCHLTHEKALLQQENIQTQHQIDLRDEQYYRITETINATRKIRHDMKHHIFAIQGFLAEGDIKKIDAYLNEYLDTVNQYDIINICSNPIVNMIVSHYYTQAKEKQIDFNIRIQIPKELPIQNSDISVLLGNLLENAITAATTAPDGQCSISLNIVTVMGKTLVITVDNGFNGLVEYKNGKYLSIKPDHNGLGIKSITDIASKYNGDVEFTHEDTIFHSSVILEFA